MMEEIGQGEGADEARAQMNMLRNKISEMQRVISQVPPEIPEIDWSYYESVIWHPTLVQRVREEYESMPPPDFDGLTTMRREEDDALETLMEDTSSFVHEMEFKAGELRVELDKFRATQSVTEDTTIEEVIDRHPDWLQKIKDDAEAGEWDLPEYTVDAPKQSSS
jgi:arginyl-tRNA synthetase